MFILYCYIIFALEIPLYIDDDDNFTEQDKIIFYAFSKSIKDSFVMLIFFLLKFHSLKVDQKLANLILNFWTIFIYNSFQFEALNFFTFKKIFHYGDPKSQNETGLFWDS